MLVSVPCQECGAGNVPLGEDPGYCGDNLVLLCRVLNHSLCFLLFTFVGQPPPDSGAQCGEAMGYVVEARCFSSTVDPLSGKIFDPTPTWQVDQEGSPEDGESDVSGWASCVWKFGLFDFGRPACTVRWNEAETDVGSASGLASYNKLDMPHPVWYPRRQAQPLAQGSLREDMRYTHDGPVDSGPGRRHVPQLVLLQVSSLLIFSALVLLVRPLPLQILTLAGFAVSTANRIYWRSSQRHGGGQLTTKEFCAMFFAK